MVKVNCPYCGFKNKYVNVSADSDDSRIVTCDPDEGGCEKEFVLHVKIKAVIGTQKIDSKIVWDSDVDAEKVAPTMVACDTCFKLVSSEAVKPLNEDKLCLHCYVNAIKELK